MQPDVATWQTNSYIDSNAIDLTLTDCMSASFSMHHLFHCQ